VINEGLLEGSLDNDVLVSWEGSWSVGELSLIGC